MLRQSFPEILNDLPSDNSYDAQNGSLPDNQLVEVLQTWEAIASLDPDTAPVPLIACKSRIGVAQDLYDRINLAPGMRLTGRSNGDHLQSLQTALQLFAELAEIDL